MGSMDDVVFMDQVKRSERGLAESFWLAMAGGVPVPPGGEEEGEEEESGEGAKNDGGDFSVEQTQKTLDLPVLPDPGEELFSSLLEEEERTPPDVFSDLSTVLLSMDLNGGDGRDGEGERWRGTTGERKIERTDKEEMRERVGGEKQREKRGDSGRKQERGRMK